MECGGDSHKIILTGSKYALRKDCNLCETFFFASDKVDIALICGPGAYLEKKNDFFLPRVTDL